jgi:hypothetical protein
VPLFPQSPPHDHFFDEAVRTERRLGLLDGLPARDVTAIALAAYSRLLDRDIDGTPFVIGGRERCPTCGHPTTDELAQPVSEYVELPLIVAPHERWDTLTEAERERESTAATRAAIADHKLRMR